MIEKVYSSICSNISKQKKMYEKYKEEIYEINVSSLKHISAFGAIIGAALVMLLLPLMIIDYPQRIIFVNLVMSVSFILIAALTKTNEHVLLLDISDAVVVFFLSSFFILRTTRQQLINFENVQSEKDELMEKNNLINAIPGTVALAKDETDNPKAISNYLNTVDVSSHFLPDLINDILDLNKIESGKIELHPECCMVSDYVRNIEASIRPLTDKKHIDFQIHMNCGLKEIYVDTVRHHQIFFNLLSNAAKYTPEYGHIEYSTMMIDAPEGMIGVRNIVSDDGIGMSKSFLEHIFEPFSRASDVVINQTEGSGLGLSIVKNIVDAMDGSIEVKSEPGKGTTFIVDLYMQSIAGKNGNKKSINYNDSDLAGKKVLLVEDNEINVCIAVKLLEKKGCIVTSVSNGLEAVKYMEKSKENEVDIILMDIRMPVMNGIDATREIRQIDKEFIKNIPVYAMTADAFAEDIDRMKQVGMNGHIPKPINPDLLYSTIARL